RRLDFVTRVDWQESHRLLKVSFPLRVQADEGINEIQFGYVKRPTHRSRVYDADRFEVCNQRWTALCEQGHGAALLNDCKYGISMHGSDLRLTLLRGGTSPEMGADKGSHAFTYALTAWEGSLLDAPVVREAYQLNVRPAVTSGRGEDFSAFSLDAANVFIDTLKPAQDGSGDLILRLYEAKRASTSCELAITLPVRRAQLCDMLENPQQTLPLRDGRVRLDFGPFQVLTLRLTP
ncbi:MAG TPA: glycoside hydrolase family 38 C-terminal domain-containing protein, partial [Clostridia bacterium]|nr:glycoside hydrolase family 38 C-terminal domain-containing protein [Clostridia bacterium]